MTAEAFPESRVEKEASRCVYFRAVYTTHEDCVVAVHKKWQTEQGAYQDLYPTSPRQMKTLLHLHLAHVLAIKADWRAEQQASRDKAWS